MNPIANEMTMVYLDIATKDFLTDAVLAPDDKSFPIPTTIITSIPACCFTVLQVHEEDALWGVKGSPVKIYRLVLMDGSMSVFSGVTDTCLSGLLSGKNLTPGCTVVIREYSWIWKFSNNKTEWRAVMLIRSMGWYYPPTQSLSPTCTQPSQRKRKAIVSSEKQEKETVASSLLDIADDGAAAGDVLLARVCLYRKIMVTCLRHSRFVFTMTAVDMPCYYRWDRWCAYEALTDKLAAGDWIVKEETKQNWRDSMGDRFEVIDSVTKQSSTAGVLVGTLIEQDPFDADTVEWQCECKVAFGHRVCVLRALPLGTVDLPQLFLCTQHWMDRNSHSEDAKTFGDLSCLHKRQCYYWYYAINAFELRDTSRPLPSCFLRAVLDLFPTSTRD